MMVHICVQIVFISAKDKKHEGEDFHVQFISRGNMRRIKLSQPIWPPKRILLQFNKHLAVTIGKQSAYCD